MMPPTARGHLERLASVQCAQIRPKVGKRPSVTPGSHAVNEVRDQYPLSLKFRGGVAHGVAFGQKVRPLKTSEDEGVLTNAGECARTRKDPRYPTRAVVTIDPKYAEV